MSVIHHQLNMALQKLAMDVEDITAIMFDCSNKMDCTFLI